MPRWKSVPLGRVPGWLSLVPWWIFRRLWHIWETKQLHQLHNKSPAMAMPPCLVSSIWLLATSRVKHLRDIHVIDQHYNHIINHHSLTTVTYSNQLVKRDMTNVRKLDITGKLFFKEHTNTHSGMLSLFQMGGVRNLWTSPLIGTDKEPCLEGLFHMSPNASIRAHGSHCVQDWGKRSENAPQEYSVKRSTHICVYPWGQDII